MIKAIKLLAQVVPVRPLDAPDDNSAQEAQEYLENVQFQQIYVSGDMNFVYQGNGQPQFGKLEPGDVITEGESS